MGKSQELLDKFRLNSDDCELACNLADAFAEEGQLKKAILVYQHAVDTQPSFARAWYGGGCAEIERADFTAACGWFRGALNAYPDWLEAKHNLARCLYELGLVSEAFALFLECGERSERSLAMAAVIAPGVPQLNHAAVLEVRRAWTSQFGCSPRPRSSFSRPLRVGYVSSFFHRDNWMKPVWGLVRKHNPATVHVTLFSDGPPQDGAIDISHLSNDDLAELIARHGIDIVVDLNGYSNMRRLPMFASRPVPVTIGWFNLYATSGFEAFDYLIGDDVVIRPDEEQFYSEKILRVAGSYLTFEVCYPVPDVAVRGAGSEFVFGALASPYKITDDVIQAWCRILLRRPESTLLIKNKQMGSDAGKENLIRRFAAFGIGPERLQLEPPEPHYEFLEAYGRVDLALDTFPYNGGTTTTEALWQGVPVVTFYGDRWASRTSASILYAAGLSQFVAADVDGYIELAATCDPRPLRASMRQMLRASRVCDTGGFARQMEALYNKAITDLLGRAL